jgi:LuxR family transcriptional regulator, maltose regulon positive regulatory protein
VHTVETGLLGGPAAGQLAGPVDGTALPALPVALLPARFMPPDVRAGIVPRAGLLDRLLHADELVVAVVAPPGYGKTTVLAQWAARDRRPFTWLSLDRRCNDPVVLICALAVALARVVPVDRAVFDLLTAAHRLQREAVVAGLAAAVAHAPRPFVLALDDVHLLSDDEGLDAVRAVLQHLGAGSQLALAGRREPACGLPRLRGEGRVLDVGTAQLRLDAVGARDLLAAAGARVSPGQVTELLARTEGWPIGLYFAALARHAAAVPQVHHDAFFGEDRLLADYIRTEFLAHLPEHRLRFLTRTSLLDELCGPLCDAMLQRTGSAADLDEIEASNLLLAPLDRQRRWYRYHPLFQTLLRQELERREPAAVPTLTRRASRWCEINGLFDSAVHYAQLADDAGRVNEILRRGALRQFAAGRAIALARWLAWLTERGGVDAGVAAIGAMVSVLSGLPAEADRWAAATESGDPAAEQPDGSPLEGWVLTMRAVMARDAQQMRRDAARALHLLSPTSQWRGTAVTCLGLAEFLAGDLDAADRDLADAAEVGVRVGALTATVSALAVRALIAIRRAHWEAADALLHHASSLIEAGHLHGYPSTALNHAVRARTAAHHQDHRAARAELAAAGRLLPTLTRALAPLAVPTRLELARAAVAVGDPPAATSFLTEAQQLLADGLRFGSLEDDVQELAAALEQLRGAAPGLPRLTPAELRLLPLLATQRSLPEIADQQFLSVHTIKAQVTSIYRKLGVSSRTQAIDRAQGLGLLPVPALAARSPQSQRGADA